MQKHRKGGKAEFYSIPEAGIYVSAHAADIAIRTLARGRDGGCDGALYLVASLQIMGSTDETMPSTRSSIVCSV